MVDSIVLFIIGFLVLVSAVIVILLCGLAFYQIFSIIVCPIRSMTERCYSSARKKRVTELMSGADECTLPKCPGERLDGYVQLILNGVFIIWYIVIMIIAVTKMVQKILTEYYIL